MRCLSVLFLYTAAALFVFLETTQPASASKKTNPIPNQDVHPGNRGKLKPSLGGMQRGESKMESTTIPIRRTNTEVKDKGGEDESSRVKPSGEDVKLSPPSKKRDDSPPNTSTGVDRRQPQKGPIPPYTRQGAFIVVPGQNLPLTSEDLKIKGGKMLEDSVDVEESKSSVEDKTPLEVPKIQLPGSQLPQMPKPGEKPKSKVEKFFGEDPTLLGVTSGVTSGGLKAATDSVILPGNREGISPLEKKGKGLNLPTKGPGSLHSKTDPVISPSGNNDNSGGRRLVPLPRAMAPIRAPPDGSDISRGEILALAMFSNAVNVAVTRMLTMATLRAASTTSTSEQAPVEGKHAVTARSSFSKSKSSVKRQISDVERLALELEQLRSVVTSMPPSFYCAFGIEMIDTILYLSQLEVPPALAIVDQILTAKEALVKYASRVGEFVLPPGAPGKWPFKDYQEHEMKLIATLGGGAVPSINPVSKEVMRWGFVIGDLQTVLERINVLWYTFDNWLQLYVQLRLFNRNVRVYHIFKENGLDILLANALFKIDACIKTMPPEAKGKGLKKSRAQTEAYEASEKLMLAIRELDPKKQEYDEWQRTH